MKIKYADVPKMETLQRLISVSFDSPRKNLAVYKFYVEMSKHTSYIENERMKLFQKYGEADNNNPCLYKIAPNTEAMKAFMKEWTETLNMEIEEDVKPLPITEFDISNNCTYSPEKADWLSAKDILAILRFCE